MYNSRFVIGDKLMLRYDFVADNCLLVKGSVITIVGIDHVDGVYDIKTKNNKEFAFKEDILRRGTNFWRDPTDRFYERYDDQ
jgi:hypothetical protein